MKVLIACEYSAVVRDAFRAKGHDAWSCDLLPTEGDSRWHVQTDVLNILDLGWDLMIAHPDCTYLTNAGVCHLHKDLSRWGKMRNGAQFFKKLLEAKIPMKAVENPIMHKYAVEIIGRRQNQVVQPYMFGHTEQKATCLWLEEWKVLQPSNNVKDEMMLLPKNKRQRLHYLSPGPERWKERSRTFKGIAEAMADQWGAL